MRLTAGVRAATLRGGAGLLVAALVAAGAVTVPEGDGNGLRHSGDASALPAGALTVLGTDDPGGSDIEPALGEPPATEDVASSARRRAPGAAVRPPEEDPARPAKPIAEGVDPSVPAADPDTLLVTFAAGTSQDTIDATLDAAGVPGGTRLDGTTTVEVATGDADHATLTAALEDSSAVELVEPNLLRHAAKVPNDPERAAQDAWLNTVGAPTAWDSANMGAAATVAVLDTGVDLDHPDLKPNLVAGYDFVNGDSVPMDDYGHGTMVAGLIGAVTQNGIGVAGVAWNAKIMPLKVLDAGGNGTDADVAAGIRFATNAGVDVINLSLGGPGTTEVLRSAVQYAADHNVLVVAAAGNGSTTALSYPAAYPYEPVLGVTATDSAGQFAWFSNHGWWVDLAAPGVDVRTTALSPATNVGTDDGTGTSFSSPIVAGVAALAVERHPTWSATTLSRELTRTARDAGPAGFDHAYGFGIVNAAAMLGIAPTAAVAQPNLVGDAGNLPSSARPIATGSSTAESLGYEYDDDWFSFDVAAAGGVTVTVTPPAAQTVGTRAKELDPVVRVHGPGGGRVGAVDDGFEGQTETVSFNAAAGTHRIHVLNYLGSAGPSPYSVQVQVGQPPFSSFAAPTTWAGGVAPGPPAVADVTGDGRVDTLVAAGSTLTVQAQAAGGGAPTAQALTLHNTAAVGQRPIVGDLDGDGDTDVAVAVNSGLDVAWQGAGVLAAPVLFPAGVDTNSVVTGAQLDGTGALEIVKGARSGSDLAALRWNGTGFTATALFTRPAGSDFAVGDVNGDGRTDVVTFTSAWAPSVAATVTVRAQQSGGAWTTPQQFPMSDVANSFLASAIGDVSNDGRNDVLLTSGGKGPVPPLLVTFRQGSDGRLTPILQAIDADAYGVQVADVTADGRRDAVVLHTAAGGGAPALSVFRQNDLGRLSFSEVAVTLPTGTTYGLGLGELTGDALGDIAVAHQSGVLVVRQQQVPTPTPETVRPWIESATPAPNATGVASSTEPRVTLSRAVDQTSLTNDTIWLEDARTGWWVLADFFFADARTIWILPGEPLTPGAPYTIVLNGVRDTAGQEVFGSLTFTVAPAAAPTTFTVNSTYSPIPLDIDVNGYDDISWYTPATTLDPLWRFGPDGQWDDGTWDVRGTYLPVAGDFDGNGYEDVFWYSPGAGYDEMWFHGPPSGGFLSRTRKSYPVSGTYIPVAGDFDRNGYDDIFWYGPGGTAETLWKFKPGGFTSAVQPAVAGMTYRLAAGDFNRDGFDDIFWHQPGTGTEALWRGAAAGFNRLATTNVNGTYNLRAGDFTGDGFDDLYWWSGSTASLWRGGVTFTSQPAPAVATTARPVAGDFTGDGRDDLIAYVPGATPDPLLPGTPTGL